MRKLLILLSILVLASTACGLVNLLEPEPATPAAATVEPTEPPAPTETPEPAPTETQEPLTLEETTDRIIQALAAMDMAAVAEFVHPEMGVRFSPYTYVEEEHLVFMAGELPGLPEADKVYTWGAYDGTGDPIKLTFAEYYEAFVYKADFANPEEMAVNQEIGWSSMINNIGDFYPESSFVEYHFSGFEEEYMGLDWASLRLVLVEEEGTWYLVGIVNDQWTI